jgi:metal-responsive CopG/Arc/MetJ family transcriptional regulator
VSSLAVNLEAQKIMRARITLVIEEYLLAKVDAIAGDKLKRSATIVKAIAEFIIREEAEAPKTATAEVSVK